MKFTQHILNEIQFSLVRTVVFLSVIVFEKNDMGVRVRIKDKFKFYAAVTLRC